MLAGLNTGHMDVAKGGGGTPRRDISCKQITDDKVFRAHIADDKAGYRAEGRPSQNSF